MSDKIERYNEIIKDLRTIPTGTFLDCEPIRDVKVEAILKIRGLRQIIERLRRIVDDEQPPVEVHSLQDAMKLNKDELAFLAWQFFQWLNGEDCPADTCKDFPCHYRHEIKAEFEENLQNGDIDAETMKKQHDNGYFACYCDGARQGCWAEYYLWCYRNGVNPMNGKKEAK